MQPHEIRQALAERGVTLTMLATATGYSIGMISRVLNGKATSFPVAEAFAKTLDRDLYEVFPTYKDIVPRVRTSRAQQREKLEKLKQTVA